MMVNELLLVFEKMYLQEGETKEKITIRIQIIFTIIVALVTVSSYMLRMLDYRQENFIALIILGLIFVFIFLIIFSCFYSVRAFWGNTFKKIPPANELRNYATEMDMYARLTKDLGTDEVDVRIEIEKYLCDVYCECASHNYEVNEMRSRRAHVSFIFLLGSILFLSFAGALFVIYDMDASSPRKDFQIVDRHLADRIGEVKSELELVVQSANNLSEVILMVSKNNGDPNKKEPVKVEPIKQSIPVKPVPPKVRITLEDISSINFEVKDDSSKE